MQKHEKSVRARYDAAVEDIKYLFKDEPNLEIVGPCNIDKFDNNGIKEDRTHTWEWYIGEDVKILLTCDRIYMCQGYRNSRGCLLERAIAEHENKIPVIYQLNASLNLPDEI